MSHLGKPATHEWGGGGGGRRQLDVESEQIRIKYVFILYFLFDRLLV